MVDNIVLARDILVSVMVYGMLRGYASRFVDERGFEEDRG